MNARGTVGTLAAVVVLVSGCGAAGHQASSKATMDAMGHDMGNMAGMAMPAHATASSAARMICSPETADAVRRTFNLAQAPASVHGWSDRLYSCTYRLPHGRLRLTVKDDELKSRGRAYFDRLREALPATKPLTGMQNLGFPAFASAAGDVVFLKDGKTLRVDPRSVTAQDLPPGFSQLEAAYAVAAAVIACWTG